MPSSDDGLVSRGEIGSLIILSLTLNSSLVYLLIAIYGLFTFEVLHYILNRANSIHCISTYNSLQSGVDASRFDATSILVSKDRIRRYF